MPVWSSASKLRVQNIASTLCASTVYCMYCAAPQTLLPGPHAATSASAYAICHVLYRDNARDEGVNDLLEHNKGIQDAVFSALHRLAKARTSASPKWTALRVLVEFLQVGQRVVGAPLLLMVHAVGPHCALHTPSHGGWTAASSDWSVCACACIKRWYMLLEQPFDALHCPPIIMVMISVYHVPPPACRCSSSSSTPRCSCSTQTSGKRAVCFALERPSPMMLCDHC